MTNKKRPHFPKKLVKLTFNRIDNPNGQGSCWHCGKKLVFKNRKKGLRGGWHMDHYPVPYRDIENQFCLGITDSNNANNLVPSCVNCNVSHKYEKSLWYCCNRSQCKCERCCTCIIIFLLLLLFIITTSVFYYYRVLL